ncbi:hypothetical protein CMU59_17570 [Elizabethkingia anophelis]|nr:DoxX family protein [Elizabethkingia anophelis]MDV3576181.1 hypothetical protein [Elizabethkingia anophelis]MDV3601342.1 hypothetical protein [Elizabethkingia anophelis]MDV3608593.1 hypothetical protein [Elizabethkingia anophelis]MDV3640454.1 hypothetical protein [Elizabethkingia anophelis]
MKEIPLLLMRLMLSYAYLLSALSKFQHLYNNSDLGLVIDIPPMVYIMAFSGLIESLGVVLLFLGFFTNYISYLLLINMLIYGVTMFSVGVEINLYYFVMLFTLIVYGPGKYSIDYLHTQVRLSE